MNFMKIKYLQLTVIIANDNIYYKDWMVNNYEIYS